MPNTKDYDFPLLQSDVTLLVQAAVLSALEGNVYDHKKVRCLPVWCSVHLRDLRPRTAARAPRKGERLGHERHDLVYRRPAAVVSGASMRFARLLPSALIRASISTDGSTQNFKYIVTCFVRQRKGAGLEFHRCVTGGMTSTRYADGRLTDVVRALQRGGVGREGRR